MTDSSRYPAYIFWSVEDEGFIALAPTSRVAPHSAALKPKHSASCKVQSLRGARLPPRQAIRFHRRRIRLLCSPTGQSSPRRHVP